MDTVQPNSKRASCKHWMMKLPFILIIKGRRREGKWLVASHFIQSLIYLSRWLFFIWLLAFLCDISCSYLVHLTIRKENWHRVAKQPGTEIWHKSPQTCLLRKTLACRQFRKSSGTLRFWKENMFCMWIICRKRDHLMYFFNYLLRLNCEPVVRWTTTQPVIKFLKSSGIIIARALITISMEYFKKSTFYM